MSHDARTWSAPAGSRGARRAGAEEWSRLRGGRARHGGRDRRPARRAPGCEQDQRCARVPRRSGGVRRCRWARAWRGGRPARLPRVRLPVHTALPHPGRDRPAGLHLARGLSRHGHAGELPGQRPGAAPAAGGASRAGDPPALRAVHQPGGAWQPGRHAGQRGPHRALAVRPGRLRDRAARRRPRADRGQGRHGSGAVGRQHDRTGPGLRHRGAAAGPGADRADAGGLRAGRRADRGRGRPRFAGLRRGCARRSPPSRHQPRACSTPRCGGARRSGASS